MPTKGPKKPLPAFPAKEECLGGAHMILSDYISFHNRVAAAGPCQGVVGGYPHKYQACNQGGWKCKTCSQLSPAQRLSRNRAARRAAVDTGAAQHSHNMHCIDRYIEGMYSATERRKNTQDPSMYPVRQSRTVERMPVAQQHLVEPWKAGYGYSVLSVQPRPGSAPASESASKPRLSVDPYQGWSVTNNLRNTFWGDDFPLTRYPSKLPVQRERMEASVYRKAILCEVTSNGLYKEHDLKKVFNSYIKNAPLYDKATVERVVSDLKEEFLVA